MTPSSSSSFSFSSFFVLFSLLSLLLLVSPSPTHPSAPPLPELFDWPDRDRYYYPTYAHKISEIVVGCPVHILPAVNHTTESRYSFPHNASQLYLIPTPPSPQLVRSFLSIPPPRQMRVSPALCSAPYSYKRPIFNNSGCQLRHYMSPYAPRCQSALLRSTCLQAQREPGDASSSSPAFFLPEADHSRWATHLPPLPYLLAVRSGYATMCGQASASCGYVHPSTNCHTTGYRSVAAQFHRHCTPRHAAAPQQQEQGATQAGSRQTTGFVCGERTPFSRNVTRVGRVFVVAQVDDTYTYHIHLEIVPRLVYHLPFLRDNPDVHILYGCDVKNTAALTSQGLRKGLQSLRALLSFFNISNPLLVQQHVHSDTALYLPTEGACQDPLFNTWHILHMRQVVLDAWQKHHHKRVSEEYRVYLEKHGVLRGKKKKEEAEKPGRRGSRPAPYNNIPRNASLPRLVLLGRSSTSRFTRNNADLVRQWDASFLSSLSVALGERFRGRLAVQVLSDGDDFYMRCFACQVDLLAQARVLVGMHGAGLGLMTYLPTGGGGTSSAVVEIAPYGNDGRCLLGGGPFSRLAALLGHSYLTHHPRYQDFRWKAASKTADFNISALLDHLDAFLQAIRLV